MFWLLGAAHGKNILGEHIILSSFSWTWEGKRNVILAMRLWDCVAGFIVMELSVWSVTKKAAWSALWSHSIILWELPKHLSTKLKWCFKPCSLLNYIKVMSRLTCFVFFGLPSVQGNGISTVCRNLVASNGVSVFSFIKKNQKRKKKIKTEMQSACIAYRLQKSWI